MNQQQIVLSYDGHVYATASTAHAVSFITPVGSFASGQRHRYSLLSSL